MRPLKHTTELLGIKDTNIKICFTFEVSTHIEIRAKLDYPAPVCPHCQGKMIKYDFQKPSKIPLLEQAGKPTLLRLKKRRFQCQDCRRVVVAQTSIVEKNCQISNLVRTKVADLLMEKRSLTDIARKLSISISTVYRKLNQFTFKETLDRLPKIMSWDETSWKKGQLAFIAQDYETRKLITMLDNRRQTTIKDYFLKYPLKVRRQVQFITMDMAGGYIALAKQLFPHAKIVLDRFHIIQHLSRAMNTVRIQIMKQQNASSPLYRLLKYHWRLFLKDSAKLSTKRFYSRVLRCHQTPQDLIEKVTALSPDFAQHYERYQLLLHHFHAKNKEYFFSLIEEDQTTVHHAFQTVFRTFHKLRPEIENALDYPYSNAKLEATNKLIKDIKRQGFGFRNFPNFKKRIFITLNIKKERTLTILSRI